MELELMRSRADFERVGERCGERIAYEAQLARAGHGQTAWTVAGFCQVCQLAVDLHLDWDWSSGDQPNWRERLVCPNCQLNSRRRFMAQFLRAQARGVVYLYEQVTPFTVWAAATFPEVRASEYLGPDIPGGTVINGVQHEDALALSFGDGSLSVIVSNDVYEHVPDIDRALAEAARTLQPDGVLLFSIPFHSGRDETIQRAEIRDGQLVELLPPVFHGNPISAEGSLVFYDYGWSILDRCRAAGFADACAIGYWSALYGYLGSGLQVMFTATRR
jgi:SAM-dependent methyltransferase